MRREPGMRAFSSYHPSVLLIYFASVLLITMFTTHPLLLAAAFLGGICFCALLERPRVFLHSMLFYIPLFALIALTNPLFSHNGETVLFFLSGNPVTFEAFLYGVAMGAMFVSVLHWFKCCNRIMTSDKMLFLFGEMVPKLSLLLSSALRFVPLFQRQFVKISQTQKAMGMYSQDSYVDKIKSGSNVFQTMLSWSLENAMDTGTSMRARGYGVHKRSSFAVFRFAKRDAVMLALILVLSACTLSGTFVFGEVFAYYPRLSKIQLDASTGTACVAFLILCFLPFLIEMEEKLRWKYYRSKI